jgi:amino-acid N-acetyltransferase
MIHPAKIGDVSAIAKLVDHYAREGQMLPRPLAEIYEHLRDYVVVEQDGQIMGCGALQVVWDNLGEIRSLAVRRDIRRKGLGTDMVRYLLEEAQHIGLQRVFALTYLPCFFERLGFKEVSKETLPHKVWRDCLKCTKFPDCDEVAMILDLD